MTEHRIVKQSELKDFVVPAANVKAIVELQGRGNSFSAAVNYALERADSNQFTEGMRQNLVDIGNAAKKADYLFRNMWNTMQGRLPPTPFSAFTQGRAIETALPPINEQPVTLLMSQIDNDARMVVGDNHDEKVVPAQYINDQLDQWLAKHNIVYNREDQGLYQVNELGEIKTDAQGNQQRVNSDDFLQLIRDSKDGLQKFLRDNGVNAGVAAGSEQEWGQIRQIQEQEEKGVTAEQREEEVAEEAAEKVDTEEAVVEEAEEKKEEAEAEAERKPGPSSP